MSALTASFTRLRAPALPRSSHSISVVGAHAFLFGGELRAREPVDNAMHIIPLSSSAHDTLSIPAAPSVPGGPVPPARVGHTSVALNDKIYVFGGRGGPDMAALEEGARVWVFDPSTRAWAPLDPAPGTPAPPARSYHASAARQALSGGARATDVWALDTAARTWAHLPPAPGPPRGGAGLAVAGSRLCRFGGFDGTGELGGQLDYLDLHALEEGWRSLIFPPAGPAPAPRSVAGLLPLGADRLLIVGGERTASNAGHEAAGKFLGDVWALPLPVTAATHGDQGTTEVQPEPVTVQLAQAEGGDSMMSPRGWFASDVFQDIDGASGFVLWGGLDEGNERLGDGWLVKIAAA
jgi:hypothetical protein